MNDTAATLADAQRMRHADREWLSLALMQARNQTLAWLALAKARRCVAADRDEGFAGFRSCAA